MSILRTWCPAALATHRARVTPAHKIAAVRKHTMGTTARVYRGGLVTGATPAFLTVQCTTVVMVRLV